MHTKELFLRKYVQIYRPLLQKEVKKERKQNLVVKAPLNLNAAA